MGEGIVENPQLAITYFRRAAHLGHTGAAYMLGECLLNGVGATRDRTDALEWLVTAAELGHVMAQHRVLLLLHADYYPHTMELSNIDQQRQQESKTRPQCPAQGRSECGFLTDL